MILIKYSYTISFALLILIQVGCSQYPEIQEPDTLMFNKTVYSKELRDSLQQGKLVAGMPHFVVSQLFKNWTSSNQELKIPVASLGSKQRLEETEGLGRVFVDPNAGVFLDEYETPGGKLYVWYRRPDFYTMNVSANDTLCIFLEDTVICSSVKCLNNSLVLTLKDSLPEIPVHKTLYGEVSYNENWSDVSYWYNIEILRNSRSIKITGESYETYPIEFLEFNNEPINSFKWREVNKNEN